MSHWDQPGRDPEAESPFHSFEINSRGINYLNGQKCIKVSEKKNNNIGDDLSKFVVESFFYA